jgi:hypothetical protein
MFLLKWRHGRVPMNAVFPLYKDVRVMIAIARYNYSFVVWPADQWGFDRSIFTLFQAMGVRVELEFTEPEFEIFRSGLSHHGLTLREIERVPYRDPEPVY